MDAAVSLGKLESTSDRFKIVNKKDCKGWWCKDDDKDHKGDHDNKDHHDDKDGKRKDGKDEKGKDGKDKKGKDGKDGTY